MSSNRIPYPGLMKLDTKNAADTARDNPSSAASPSKSATERSRLPPGPTEAGKSPRMSSKRPAHSPITAGAEKRPRVGEKIRSTSTGTSVASRQGAILATAKSPSDAMINPSRDPRKKSRAQVGSDSPNRVASPQSMTQSEAGYTGSGNSTPVHGAPAAPAMVPSTVPMPYRNPKEPARGVASIREAAAKKRGLGTAATETTAIASIRAKHTLQVQEVEKLKADLQAERLGRSDLVKLVAQLEDRLRRLEEPRAAPADQGWSQAVKELSERVLRLETSRKEPMKDGTTLIRSEVEKRAKTSDDAVGERLNKIEANIKTHSNKLFVLSTQGSDPTGLHIRQLLEADVKDLTKKYSEISSWKQTVDEDTRSIKSSIGTLSDISDWKQSIDEETKSFKSSIAALQNSTKELSSKNSSYMIKSADLEVRLDNFVVKSDEIEKKLAGTDVLAERLDAVEATIDKSKKFSHKQIDEIKASVKKLDAPAANKKRFDAISEKLDALELETTAIKNADLQKQLDDLKTEIANQKKAADERTRQAGKQSEKSTVDLVQSLRAELEAVRMESKSGIDECANIVTVVTQQVDTLSQEFNKFRDEFSSLKTNQEALVKMADTIRNEAKQDKIDAKYRLEKLQSHMKDTMDKTLAEVNERIPHDLANELEALGSKNAAIAADIEYVESQLKVGLDNLSTELRSKVSTDTFENKMGSRTLDSGPSALSDNVQDLTDEVHSLSKEVGGAMRTAESAKNLAESLGTGLIVDFERMVESKLDAIRGEIQTVKAAVEAAREQAPAEPQRVDTAQPGSSSSPANRPGESVNANFPIAMQQIARVEEQMRQQMEIIILAQKSIEQRMQNVTTEELYRQMVHWISQTYPSPQNFMGELSNLRGLIDEIGKVVHGVGWMYGPERSTQLLNLAERCDLIVQFFEEARGQNFRSIQDLIVQGDEKLSQEIQSLRTEVANERSKRSSGATNDAAADSQGSRLNSMGAQIDSLNVSHEGVNNELDDLNQRLAVVNNRIDAVEESSKKQNTTPTQQQQLIGRMRTNVAALNITAFEHQEAILAVNHQLRGGGFEFKFSHDFKRPPEL